MKIRTDFVTNSSSSSFICAFRNKADFNAHMENLKSWHSQYFEIIYNDILSHRISRAQALKELKDCYVRDAKFRLYWQKRDYQNWNKKLAEHGLKYWQLEELPEFKKLMDEYIENNMKRAEEELPHRGIIASVEYGDDTDFYAALEQDIMPRLPFVFEMISHH